MHCRETAGLDHLDVLYYERHGLMTLRPMTAEERREVLSRWDDHRPTRTDASSIDSLEGAELAPGASNDVNAVPQLSAGDDEDDKTHWVGLDQDSSEAVIPLPHRPVQSDATTRISQQSPPVNSMGAIPGSQAERDRAYLDAAERGAWETAHRIAHYGFPPDATVRRAVCLGRKEVPHAGRDESARPGPTRGLGCVSYVRNKGLEDPRRMAGLLRQEETKVPAAPMPERNGKGSNGRSGYSSCIP